MTNRPTLPQLIAAAAIGGCLPFDRPGRRHTPPADPGHFKSKRRRSREYTAEDFRAKQKRIAKWRAKKGYK